MKPAFLFVILAYVANLLLAGQLTVTEVSEKIEPFKQIDLKVYETQMIKTYGEKQGKEMFARTLELMKDNPQHYSVSLENSDRIRKVVRAEMQLEFQDSRAKVLGEKIESFNIEIKPKGSESVLIECDKYGVMCRDSTRLTATVRKTDWVEIKFGSKDEIEFEWKESRWFLENQWDKEKMLTLRSFSGSYYTDKDFDRRVFPPGGVEADKKRFYRVVKEPIPGGYPEDSVLYEIEQFWHEALPGFIVENGQSKKPRLLDGRISNVKVQGTIANGEYVRMRNAFSDKKTVEVTVSPVCQTGPHHSALIGKVRFVLGEKGVGDPESVDKAIRAWLEPVSIGEVAKSCGPSSGNPVRRWNATTTIDDIESALGPAEARKDVKGGEVLAYGDLRLKFVEGKLAGLERKSPR